MTYAGKELSVEDSAPILLFQFVQGGTTWRITNSATTITRTNPYYPAAITTSTFSQSGEMPRDTLTITLPISHSLSESFLGYSPDVITTVTVWRTHADDSATLVYWKGRVANAKATATVVSLECEPIFSSLRRLGLSQTYQRTCRHALFGAGCMLDADDFDHAVTVTAVAGALLTITEAAALGTLVGGTFKAPDGTIRMITKHDGTAVTLMRRIKSLDAALIAEPAGFAATVYHGCDRSAKTCDETYANLANFGGFIGIPQTNPMGGGDAF